MGGYGVPGEVEMMKSTLLLGKDATVLRGFCCQNTGKIGGNLSVRCLPEHPQRTRAGASLAHRKSSGTIPYAHACTVGQKPG